MRIEGINLSRESYESMEIGLLSLPMDEPLKLGHFGQCVVLAGQNGSGKTRLLSLIGEVAKKYVDPGTYRRIEAEVSEKQETKKSFQKRVAQVEAQDLEEGKRTAEIKRLSRGLEENEKDIKQIQIALTASDALTVSGDGTPKILLFVPKSTELKDPENGTEGDANRLSMEFSGWGGVERTHIAAPAYARSIMRAATQERGARERSPGTEKHDAETALIKIFTDLLGDDVSFELSSSLNLKLKGLTDRYDTLLSEGQKVLFQLACMLHAREVALSDCILILDEPENHLHPAVLNKVIDRLRKALTDGQLWIATHSVPLIAHLVATDPDCLWYAENGKFSRAGRAPEKVLNSLLGGRLGASRVNDLTLMASRYASFLLLRQCLLPPGVIGYEGQDPQLSQIRNVLKREHPVDRPLSLLDFGSGKGRLLDAIADAAGDAHISTLLDYVAYERSDDADYCQKRCEELYGTESKSRAFKALETILNVRGEKFADVAIVCNVLHEVHPDEWLEEFGANSGLARLVKDEGYVLFVEDYGIPVGERAHDYGFLLLDQSELQLLFGITDEDVVRGWFNRNDHMEKRYEGRLIAHAISARCLKRMSEETRRNAIQSLHDRSLERLRELLQVRQDSNTPSSFGRESALVTQLIANAALWLRDNNEKGQKISQP